MTARRARAVAIGASAGAVDALSVILPRLPANYPLPIMVVVHVPPDRRSLLAPVFRAKCQVDVREAEDKEPVAPGVVYFAPSDYHLLVEKEETLSLSNDEPLLFSRPAIDVLFESAADVYGAALIAIVLTGANHDGAAGLKTVAAAGGLAIVQDWRDAFAAEMPRAAARACPAAVALSLEQIARYLLDVERS